MEEEQDLRKRSKYLLILLLGVLSMHFAEVFSGSSPLWFLNPFLILVTMPLYLAHALFLLNIALHTKRYSLPHLFLYGTIFGLYESWITKVLWSGYPNSDGPILGLVGGIAIFEFIVLVLYFHNIYAFIIPIIVVEVFSRSWNKNTTPSPFSRQIGVDIQNRRRLKYFIIYILVFGSPGLAASSDYNPISVTVTVLGSLAIVFTLDTLIRRRYQKQQLSIFSLKLGRRGMILLTSYLVLLYVVTFIGLVPEKLPTNPLPYILIILVYLAVGLILLRSHQVDTMEIQKDREEIIGDFIDRRLVYQFVGCYWLLALLFTIIPPVIGLIVFVVIQLPLLIIGPFLLVKAVRAVL